MLGLRREYSHTSDAAIWRGTIMIIMFKLITAFSTDASLVSPPTLELTARWDASSCRLSRSEVYAHHAARSVRDVHGSWIVLYMLIIELAVSAMFTALYTALSARDVCLRAVPFFKVLAVVRVLPGVLWTLILDFRYAGVIQLCWTPVSSPGPTCRSQVGSRCHRVHAREVCIVARLLIRAVDLWSGIGARNVTS